MHEPLGSVVVHAPVSLTAPGGVRVTVKYTVCPPIGLPNWSSTVAVTVWLVPTVFVAVGGLSVTVVGTGTKIGFAAVIFPSRLKYAESPGFRPPARKLTVPVVFATLMLLKLVFFPAYP